MFQTKIFTREMERIHGKVFVWTYKGDIFIRKNTRFAPKKKIASFNDLQKIRSGEDSLDPTPRENTDRKSLTLAQTEPGIRTDRESSERRSSEGDLSERYPMVAAFD